MEERKSIRAEDLVAEESSPINIYIKHRLALFESLLTQEGYIKTLFGYGKEIVSEVHHSIVYEYHRIMSENTGIPSVLAQAFVSISLLDHIQIILNVYVGAPYYFHFSSVGEAVERIRLISHSVRERGVAGREVASYLVPFVTVYLFNYERVTGEESDEAGIFIVDMAREFQNNRKIRQVLSSLRVAVDTRLEQIPEHLPLEEKYDRVMQIRL